MTRRPKFNKPAKNPAAVALGRLGGRARAKKLTKAQLKRAGRKAAQERAKSLTKEQRREIARNAALARWRGK